MRVKGGNLQVLGTKERLTFMKTGQQKSSGKLGLPFETSERHRYQVKSMLARKSKIIPVFWSPGSAMEEQRQQGK